MRKKIAIAANEEYGSLQAGLPRFLYEIIPRLAKTFDLRLMLNSRDSRFHHYFFSEHIEVFEYPTFFWEKRYKSYTWFGLRALKPIWTSDLFFVQSSNCIVPILFAKLLRIPMVTYLHEAVWNAIPNFYGLNGLSAPVEKVVRRLSRQFFNSCRHVFIPSSVFLDSLKSLGVQTPISTVPLGVDHTEFRPAVNCTLSKEKLGFKQSDLVMGYVGRLAPEKNVELLLHLFQKFKPSLPSLKLLIVGRGPHDIEAKFGGCPDIKLVGWQQNVGPFYQAMDIFCMPCPLETTSLATLEAMSSGLPCVVYRSGRIQEYLRHKENGFLIESGCVTDFEATIEILLTNPLLRIAVGQKARESMCRYISWEDTANNLTLNLNEILFSP